MLIEKAMTYFAKILNKLWPSEKTMNEDAKETIKLISNTYRSPPHSLVHTAPDF